MHIKLATPEDAHAIADVHVAAWRQAYRDILPAEFLAQLSVPQREAMWAETIAKGVPELLVARADGRVVGFIAFGPCRDDDAPQDAAEIWAIYLLPSAWSSGVGRVLWLAARRRLVEQGRNCVNLWVVTKNQRAIRFYLAAGFHAEPETQKEFTFGGVPEQKIRYVQVIRG